MTQDGGAAGDRLPDQDEREEHRHEQGLLRGARAG